MSCFVFGGLKCVTMLGKVFITYLIHKDQPVHLLSRVRPFMIFDLGFTALSRIFHLYRADRSSKVGENQRTQGKTT